MKKIHITFAFLLIVGFSFAQKDPVKYGKFTDDEIKLQEYQGYDAVILADYGTYSFDAHAGKLYFYHSRHLRIKILNESGLKYACQNVLFYNLKMADYFNSNLTYELKAQTINFDQKGKISKSKVKTKYRSESDTDGKFITLLTINFPDVKVGSIIEYEINIPTIEVVNPPSWFFQHELPVMYSELRVTTPEYISYSGKTYNVDKLDLSEKTPLMGIISYYKGGSFSIQSYMMRFVKTNIPPAVDDMAWYDRMRVKIMLDNASQRIYIPGAKELFKATDPEYKYRDRAAKYSTLSNSGYILYDSPTLENLPQKLQKDLSFGPPMSIYLNFSDSLNLLIKDLKSDEEKVQKIYDLVRNTMEWNGEFRWYVDPAFPKLARNVISRFTSNSDVLNRSLSKPLDQGKGNNAEINFILINALKRAGYNVYPVLTSTLNHSFLDPTFFNLHQFNHVVAYIEIDGNGYLLDATQTGKGSILESIPMNPVGLRIDPDKATWIEIIKETE